MNEEITALKTELALLKIHFSKRVGAVENRLNDLLAQEEKLNITQTEEVTTFKVQEAISDKTYSVSETKMVNEDRSSNQTQQKFQLALPSFFTLFIQTILSTFFDWLSPITKIYESYKARGMLGIFILTIVGVGLTLAGFGYLMQLLIDQLGAGYKSLLMCIAAIFVMGLGITLKIRTHFSEFATAIVTLGILLSYSTVYFAGSVHGILPNFSVVVLYLLIALSCHILALWLDTKVVAALGIIGIATMPIFSNTISIEPLYYLLSLAFVVCSSLALAFRHVGQWLAHLSLALTLVSLEWVIGFENIQLSAWLVNLFYLLFLAYIVITLITENQAAKQTLTFLAALTGSTILVFFQTADVSTNAISLNFAFNTITTVMVSVLLYKIKRKLTHSFIFISAIWGVLTIVSAISDAYWGIAWAVEGLLLITLGRKYQIPSAINQGQALTLIALVYSWVALAMYFPLPALQSIDGWLLASMIIIITAIWQRLINNSNIFNQFTQKRVKPLLQFVEVLWLSILVIASADIWLGHWTGGLAILLQIALLFRAKYCKQVSIEVFAALLIMVPLYYGYHGAVLVDSYRFTLLPLFAQLAIISAFLQLWLWSAFYRKYQPESTIKQVAESVRVIFYLLLPICWIGSVIRHFDEASLLLLWLSPLLALLLTNKVKHHLLRTETKILTGLASVAFALFVGQLSLIKGVLVLIAFSSYYAFAHLCNRKVADSLYQFICSWGVMSLGVAIPNIVLFHTDNLLYSLVVAALYWSALFNATSLSEHLRRNAALITIINLLLVASAWLLIPSNASYIIAPIIFLLAALYRKDQRFTNSLLGKSFNLNGDLLLHSIAAVSYVIALASFTEYRLDLLIAPSLAIHGALVLFLKDRRLTTIKYSFALILLGIVKLAIIDAENALLWQKVILFMGVGIFILGASFWYQKLVSNPNDKTAIN